MGSSTNDLLGLLDDLLHNLLHDGVALLLVASAGILGLLGRVGILGKAEDLPLLGLDLLLPAQPREPLAENALALLDNGGIGNVHGVSVLLVELLRVLAQVLAHLLLLLLAEQGRGAGAPEELLELLGRVLGEGSSGESVQVPAVFHLEIEN